MKSDMTVQTANALRVIGYVSDLIPYMNVAQINFFSSVNKIVIGPSSFAMCKLDIWFYATNYFVLSTLP